MKVVEQGKAGFRRGSIQPSGRSNHTPAISTRLLSLFSTYSRFYLRKHFRTLYLAGPIPRLDESAQPTIIYLNHASWWDPLICLHLAGVIAPRLKSFAPIDADSLEKFRFFRKLGFFGVEKSSRRGAIQFLEKSVAILSHSDSVLWVTPQGEFVDARVRPTMIKGGIAHLPGLVSNLRFVPLALDYFFAGDRLPSVGARLGEPIHASAFPYFTREDWQHELGASLERVQDAVAQDVTSRRIYQSKVILSGSSGMSGVYGWWQRLRGTRC